jgi:hypothetical protein
MTHAWDDILYKIYTNDVFRGDLPIVNTRFYIDLMWMSAAGIPEASISYLGMKRLSHN